MGEKLTERFINKLQPRDKTFFVWDRVVIGLGVCITPGGAKSYVVQYRNTDGRQRRLTKGACADWPLEAMRREAKQIKVRVDQGEDPMETRQQARAAPTVADLIEDYRDQHVSTLRPKSQKAYTIWLGHIERALGSKKIASVTSGDVERLKGRLSHQPSTFNRVHDVLSNFFNFAIKNGYRDDNPVARVGRYHEEPAGCYLDTEERARLIATCMAWPNRAAAGATLLALYSGARQGEILNLSWNQINFEHKIWTKPSAHTKQKKTHAIPLSQFALDVLNSMPREVEKPFGCNIDYEWRKIRKAAGLEHVRFHDLRHDHASVLVRGGATLHLVGAALGHTQSRTTERYSHIADDVLRQAVERASEHYSARQEAKVVRIK